jgi:hypothetical protein
MDTQVHRQDRLRPSTTPICPYLSSSTMTVPKRRSTPQAKLLVFTAVKCTRRFARGSIAGQPTVKARYSDVESIIFLGRQAC